MSEEKKQNEPKYYVGVGASAGGLEALQDFFSSMPLDTDLAFIVIQHLSPDFKSVMDELLGRSSKMKVYNATDGVIVQPNTIYLIPPGKNMIIAEGKLLLVEQIRDRGINFPIDIFFRSLAEDVHHRSIAIILSGTGSDGSRGIQAIKEVGGLVMVQDPVDAKFDGMPYSAIKTGYTDLVTPVSDMAIKLVQYLSHPMISDKGQSLISQLEENKSTFNQIFSLLKLRSEIDFTQYKSSTVARRIERRIGINGLRSLQEYHDLLIEKPAEIQILAKDMLIGVTRFFRDPETFDELAGKIIPKILSEVRDEEPIRIWIAGCSTGEEAYSIAILFDEALKKRKEARTVKIFATDVDPDAITEASNAQFSINVKDDISPERLKNYFHQHEDSLSIIPSIRQMVVFANHNLIKDPPFSNVHLAVCRNVLIYFQNQAQHRVLTMLHFSLRKNGYLFLGSSESLGDLKSHFETINDKSKIYRKVSNARILSAAIPAVKPNDDRTLPAPTVEQLLRSYQSSQKASHNNHVVEGLIEDYVPPCIILSEGLEVLHVYGDVSPYTRSLKSGRFTANIKDFILEKLSVAVSTAVHRALLDEKNVHYDNIRIQRAEGEFVDVSLRVRYISVPKPNPDFLAIIFEEKTVAPPDDDDDSYVYNADEQSQQRILDLETQLQKNQEHLQVTVEELETTNEELQASNEELLAANEELQSTNEELQSVNEELYTVNSEYQEKIEELTQAYADLDNIMKFANIGIVLLDEAMLIRSFNPGVEKEINLLPTDIGRPFHHIAHNLIYDTLLNDIAKVIENASMLEKEVYTKENRSIVVKLSPYFTGNNIIGGCIISLIDVTATRELEGKLNETYLELRSTIETAFIAPEGPIKVLIVDDKKEDRDLISRALAKIKSGGPSYDIVEASSGEEALECLSKIKFDVCLIDFRLGDQDALELVENLKGSASLPAFILLSEMVDKNLSEKAIHLGIYDAISKDVITPELLQRCTRYTMRQKQTETYLSQQFELDRAAEIV